MIALVVATAAAQDCAHGIDRFVADLDGAEHGYGDLDPVQFTDRLDEAALDLPCLNVAVPPLLAARYHVLVGIRAYVDGRSSDANGSFAAARNADPGFEIPVALVPQGHEIRTLFADAEPGPTAPIPPLLGGEVLLDGHPTDSRPTARPGILQLAAGDQPVLTRYLTPSDPMPDYPSPLKVLPTPTLAAPHERHPGWLVVGGLGIGASATLYALAAHSAATFAGPLPATYHEPELLSLRTRTNLLVGGSVVAGGVGALGVAGFAVGW